MSRYIKDGQEYTVTVSSPDVTHAELFSAFEYGTSIEYSLRSFAGELPESCFMHLVRDGDSRRYLIPGFHRDKDRVFTVRTDEICGREKSGLFFCFFELGELCLSFNEEGDGFVVGREGEASVCFQFSVYAPGTNRAVGYEGGIMYQIFPDRFRKGSDGLPKERAVIEENWYGPVSEYAAYPGAPLKNDHFFGGTLGGVAEKLDYLKGLGVTVLYLNPIFRAASNHRYDTGDYEHVDELLGGDAALEVLIGECKKRGIGIILDGVFNHTGSDSRYFNKYGHYESVGAYQSPDSPYYDWYYFKDYPDSYECWWGIDILPKVRSEDSSFKEYVAGEKGILDRYLDMGIAGWRLDVADELPDAMLDAIAARCKAHGENAVIIGEVWEDASNKIAYSRRRHYFTQGQLTSVMNYPLKNAIIAYLVTGRAEELFFTARNLYRHYPKAASDMQMNILGSHDTPRILNMLAGNPHEGWSPDDTARARLTAEERALAVRRLKNALILQMFMPGIPCIYYGDEIGTEGDKDPFNRQTYKWGNEDGEILSFYRQITSLRRDLPMLSDAFYRGLWYRDGVFSFERFSDRQKIVVTVNQSDRVFFTPDLGQGRTLYPERCDTCASAAVEPGSARILIYDL